ncbi:uncharacterized protein METZ01_LOCUS339667, partial [marine metagenome]
MAHTVESLSKLLKRTPDQVISILADAGIEGKTAEANISVDERKILMSSLSKRSGTKSTISVSRKTPKSHTTETLTGGVKIQVKKKREVPNVVIDSSADEAILKAQDALEVGRLADQKDQDHDAKRQDMTRLQKIKDEELITQKNQQELVTAKQEEKKATESPVPDKAKATKKQPKRLRKGLGVQSKRKELHVAHHNPNRKLKKKERTQISQKVQDEQAQHGFHMPVEPITHEVLIPETIKISELALKMTTKAGEVLKVMMSMGVMAT